MPASKFLAAARWRRPDGSVILRLRDRRLVGKQGATGPYRLVRRNCSHEEAEAYVTRQGGYRRQHDTSQAEPLASPIRRTGLTYLCQPPRPYRPPASYTPDLTEAQQAGHEAKIEAHRQRVAAELARLEEGVRRARSR